MPMKYGHGSLAAGLVLAWLTLSCCLGGARTASFRAADDKPKKEGQKSKFYYGANKNTCGQAGCHSSPPNTDEMYVCLCTEFTKWQNEDKHAKAFKVLKSERSRRMGELLGYDKDVTQWKECLSCHGAVIRNADKVDKSSFRLEEGVTCVVCHGAAREWVDFHQPFGNREIFRALTPAEKEEKYGLTDLWTPSKRAELCASCHVGSLTPGEPDKFVTHDMYAAGHPPLPSFEAATFSDQMPRHWRYRPEKRAYLSKHFREKREQIAKLLHHYGEGEERTRLALVSAAVVLRQSMLLLVRQAERCNADPSGPQAIDMASFDCYACHHDLKSPSWRQKRGYSGRPGRPPLRPWPTALTTLAIHESAVGAAEAKALDVFGTKLRAVQATIEERPYGNPQKIVPAAKDLAEWARLLALRLDKMPCDPNVARKILHEIPSFFQKETLDYDSARQVVWMFRIISQEVSENDIRVQEILATQEKMLKLRLPSGQKCDIVRELPSGLEMLNNYEPDQLKKTLRELSRCFDAKSSPETLP